MPRRKRHFVLCKKGLHKMSIYGGRKKQPRKIFEKQTYVSRICLKCRASYQRRITKRNRYNNYMRRWMRENRPSRRKKNV